MLWSIMILCLYVYFEFMLYKITGYWELLVSVIILLWDSVGDFVEVLFIDIYVIFYVVGVLNLFLS